MEILYRTILIWKFVCYMSEMLLSEVKLHVYQSKQHYFIGTRENRLLMLHRVSKAAFMLILRRQNQRFETLIQNADPKRR